MRLNRPCLSAAAAFVVSALGNTTHHHLADSDGHAAGVQAASTEQAADTATAKSDPASAAQATIQSRPQLPA